MPDWEAIKAAPLDTIAALDAEDQAFILGPMPKTYKREVAERWHQWAHKGQLPDRGDWRVWIVMAGRGFGKTRAGAEWVSMLAREDGSRKFALVGATLDDVHKVMIEGESGILAVARAHEAVEWKATAGTLTFASGAVAHVYSAEAHEKLRGPEHHFAWADELGKWNNAGACWDNLMLGLRLGERPQTLVTTTPRAMPLLRRLSAEEDVVIRQGKTAENLNLPDIFVASMEQLYRGTRFGRQELDGELLEDHEGALWSRALIDECRVADAPDLARIVVAVDPPATAGGDACGIVVAGRATDGKAYVLADCSVAGLSPEGWARAVVAAARDWNADRVLVEDNQGGDMVESTLRAVEENLPLRRVHASRSKAARAEPVAALYERGKVHHVGALPALEDEMCGMIAGGGYAGPSTGSGGRSPDRADALVWALTELMLGNAAAEPRITTL